MTLLAASDGLAAAGVWLLAGVFLWSGAVKLRRSRRAALAMVDFGVVRSPRRIHGFLLGGGELSLALLLIVADQAGLVVAAGLLWIFVVIVARSLAHGGRFSCYCFGDADQPLSWLTLARTGLLAMLATLLLAGVPAVTSFRVGGHSVLAAAVVGTALVLAGLLRAVPTVLRSTSPTGNGSGRQGGMG